MTWVYIIDALGAIRSSLRTAPSSSYLETLRNGNNPRLYCIPFALKLLQLRE